MPRFCDDSQRDAATTTAVRPANNVHTTAAPAAAAAAVEALKMVPRHRQLLVVYVIALNRIDPILCCHFFHACLRSRLREIHVFSLSLVHT